MEAPCAVVGFLVLAWACSTAGSDRQPIWIEFGIVVDEEPIPMQSGTAYPYFTHGDPAPEPVRLEQPLLRCRLSSAELGFDRLGAPAVNFALTEEDAPKFTAFTAANVDREMAVLVDGRILSKANIGEPLPGQLQIYGQFTKDECNQVLTALGHAR